MKALNCKACRNAFRKEQEKLCLECQQELLGDISNDVTKASAVAFIAVLHRRGLSKKYIQKFFKDFLLILDYPEINGKQLQSDELQQKFTELYDIDFDRITTKCTVKRK